MIIEDDKGAAYGIKAQAELWQLETRIAANYRNVMQEFEGFEDLERFAIMQKVGMTKQDIRRSGNKRSHRALSSKLNFLFFDSLK